MNQSFANETQIDKFRLSFQYIIVKNLLNYLNLPYFLEQYRSL